MSPPCLPRRIDDEARGLAVEAAISLRKERNLSWPQALAEMRRRRIAAWPEGGRP
jgi:hypothetical protein